MDPILAWLVLIVGYLGPLAHVLFSPAGGSWRPPPGARCPLGPRAGWLVLVLLLGVFGWIPFWRRTRAAKASARKHPPMP